jgi:hypothetical protein
MAQHAHEKFSGVVQLIREAPNRFRESLINSFIEPDEFLKAHVSLSWKTNRGDAPDQFQELTR